MKKLIYFISFLASYLVNGQVAQWNQFPALRPACHRGTAVQALGDDAAFGLAMRKLYNDYKGPLLQLRRDSDNTTQDFFADADAKIDIAAIDNWRAGSTVFVTIWYDQSCQKRNAVQTVDVRQPRFYPDVTLPYFQGSGNQQYLTIDTPNGVQDLTNAGVEGTVITIVNSTKKNQHTFGVLTGRDRWSVHMNWGNSKLFFDPGICCNNPRNYNNVDRENVWEQYSFIRTTTNVIMRRAGVELVNGAHTTGRCTRTEDFAIGWATGNAPNNASTSGFNEFLMYNIDISTARYQQWEQNQITYWNL